MISMSWRPPPKVRLAWRSFSPPDCQPHVQYPAKATSRKAVTAIGLRRGPRVSPDRSGRIPSPSDLRQDPIAQQGELRIVVECPPIASRSRDRHLDSRLEAAWPGRQHGDAVAEKHRLLDAVGNE